MDRRLFLASVAALPIAAHMPAVAADSGVQTIDGVALRTGGLFWYQPIRLAMHQNVDLNGGLSVFDLVAPIEAGDHVLLSGQIDHKQNGVYEVGPTEWKKIETDESNATVYEPDTNSIWTRMGDLWAIWDTRI